VLSNTTTTTTTTTAAVVAAATAAATSSSAATKSMIQSLLTSPLPTQSKQQQQQQQRPTSPCSGQPLKRKDCREIQWERERDHISDTNKRQQENRSSSTSSSKSVTLGAVLCSFSGKPILHQPAIAIFAPTLPTGYVVSKQSYVNYIQPTMTCPKTNSKLSERRHVVPLV
jgi:hypothetical protein